MGFATGLRVLKCPCVLLELNLVSAPRGREGAGRGMWELGGRQGAVAP